MELISREEAIKIIRGWFEIINLNPDILVDSINSLPTIKEREKGKWLHAEMIDDDEDFGVNSDATQCSICGDYQEGYYWAKTYYHYCPNCGAKMEENR